MARVPTHGLRHEAGLNAGRVLPLEHGRYAFGPKNTGEGDRERTDGTGPEPSEVTFELEVNDDGVVLTPVGVPVAVDGRPISVATPVLHGQIIEAGVDRFVLEPHGRPLVAPTAPRRLVAPRLEPLPSASAIRRRRAKKRLAETQERRQRHLSQFEVDTEKALRAESIGRRTGVGLPVDVTRAAENGTAHALARSGAMAIGLTTGPVAFNPDVTGNTAGEVGEVLGRYSRLSSVPFIIDLNHHRLGLVGPRDAILSVSRHLLTANATGTEPWLIDLRVSPEQTDDWGPLATLPTLARPVDRLLVLDGVSTDLDPPSAIALAHDAATLPIGCSAVLTINADGSATISLGEDEPVGVIPLGIGADHAADIGRRLQQSGIAPQSQMAPSQPVAAPVAPPSPSAPRPSTPPPTARPPSAPPPSRSLPTQPTKATQTTASDDLATGAVLVTGTDPTTTTEVLSSLAVDLLVRPENRNLTVHVIDAGDRSLIRLRQLDQTGGYAPADDLGAIETLLGAIERGLTTPTPQPAVLIANQIGPLLSFLERVQRLDLVDRITSLIGFHDRVRLLVAASGPLPSDIDGRLLDRFATHLSCDDEQNGRLASGRDERTISISSLSGHDLTSSVAGLVSAET